MKDREAIRLALCIAISSEEHLIDCHAGLTTTQAERVRADSRERIAAWKALLKRRYGGMPADPFKDAKLVPVFLLRKNRIEGET